MTIYTRWGNEVKVIANFGKHRPEGFEAPLTLLGVAYVAESKLGYYFMEFLKSTEGLTEITKAVDTLSTYTLTEKELEEAIKDAL